MKKIIATILTAIMTLSSFVGVLAADLGDYPGFLFVDHTLDSYVVYGEYAAAADVAGGTDLAVRLAGESYQLVTSAATSGESVSGGDGVRLRTPGNELTPWASMASVKGILTATDLPDMLVTDTFQSASGSSYQYKQYLYIASDSSGSAASSPANVRFERPTTENTPRIGLKTPSANNLYAYKLSFSTPVAIGTATDTDAELQAILQGTTLNMLGQDFVISDCTYSSAAVPINTMTLLGGKQVLTVGSDADTSVTVDGKEFTIHLSSVLEETVGGTTYKTAVGDINGVGFTLRSGNTVVVDGVTFGAIKVLRSGVTGGIDYLKVAAGADKIKIANSGTVTKGTATEPTLTASITATAAAGWSAMTITYAPSVDSWLAEGESVEDVFAGTFNIKFNSLKPAFDDATSRQTLTFSPSGVNMLLTYRNAGGNEKQMYSLYYDSGTWRWASVGAGSPSNYDNNWRDVIFDEGSNISAIEQDYFVVQKAGFSHTLQFTSYTPSTSELIFTDEAGNSITATNDSSNNADLIVDGNTYKVHVNETTKKIAHIDLNGDGYIAGTVTTGLGALDANNQMGREYSYLVPEKITTAQGGLYFYRGNNTVTLTSDWLYPQLGFAGIRLFNDTYPGATVTVATYSAGSWTNESTSVGAMSYATNTPSNVTYSSDYIDYIVNCWNNSVGNILCNVALGSTSSAANNIGASDMKTDSRGFVLVEEALQGTNTHNWIYLPVAYDSTNARTYINTPVSDNSHYANTAVVGTSTEYKGLTQYGTLVEYLSSTLGGSATIKYPDTYTYANVYVLAPEVTVSLTEQAGDTVKKVVPITNAVAKLDSEITSAATVGKNLVLVGGSCANDWVQELVDAGKLDATYTCEGGTPGSGWVSGEGYIWLVEDGFTTGQDVVVAAGTTRTETRKVCSVLQQYETFATQLDGNAAVKVTAVSASGITPLV
jgi:hypothetical protein